jgi:sugar transferase EpsL
MNRTADVTLAIAAGVLSLPLVVVLAVLVRWRLGAPVLFRQDRPGLDGTPFTLYKFRTMREANHAAGCPLPDSSRLTRLGRFLRSTSLDELPELWNVIRGDMSLVGPRPLLTEYLPIYDERQRRRHEVRPGLTGWAQVNGRNAVSWDERLEMDVWYVDNRSWRLDARILVMTVGAVLRRQGISAPGEATMGRFTGTTQPDVVE